MTKRKKIFLGTGLAAILGITAVAGVSYADRSHHREFRSHHHGKFMGRGMREVKRNMFRLADADDDGKVTQAEIDTAIANRLSAHDRDGNGRLSLAEFDGLWNELMQPVKVRAFQRLDPDGDAQIAGEELGDRFGRLVSRLDRNGDGAISDDDRRRRHWRRLDRDGGDREKK